MCRKDFAGYKCGHCSLPKTTPCPLTLSNPLFPLCSFIAEFVKQLDSYCGPCQRAVFTYDLLLKEKIHTEAHQRHACDCGLDFTEEEREHRRITKLSQGNAGELGSSNFEKHMSGTGQLRFQAREEPRETPKRFDVKQNGVPRQDEIPHKVNIEKYLNAPYGQHPMLPVSSQQNFRPYQPRRSFVGVDIKFGAQVAPLSPYRGNYQPIQYPTDMTMATDPMGGFLGPRAVGLEKENIAIPEQVSAEDQDVNKDVQDSPMAESVPPTNGERFSGFVLPENISNLFISPPLALHSFPVQNRAEPWDTKSL